MPGSNDDILRVLGRVEEGIHRLREDFHEEKRSAKESRSEIHKRLDRHSEDITITAQLVAQQRDVASTITKKLDDEVMPTIEEVKQIKALGRRASMIFLGMGFTAGGTFIWFSDVMITALRKWLRID